MKFESMRIVEYCGTGAASGTREIADSCEGSGKVIKVLPEGQTQDVCPKGEPSTNKFLTGITKLSSVHTADPTPPSDTPTGPQQPPVPTD